MLCTICAYYRSRGQPMTTESTKTERETELDKGIAHLTSNEPVYKVLNLGNRIAPPWAPITNLKSEMWVPIDDVVLTKIATALPLNHTVTTFKVGIYKDSPKPQCTSEGITVLANALKVHPSLNHVQMNIDFTAKFNSDKLLQLLDCLTGSANITTLVLEIDRASNSFLKGLSTILQKNKTLQTIKIIVKNKVLTRYDALTLNAFKCLTRYDDQTLNAFAQSLFVNKSLIDLRLQSVNLGDKGIEYIALHMPKTSQLLGLALHNCNITETGCTALSGILKRNKTLELVALGGNPFSKDFGTIVKALQDLVYLRALGLPYARLTWADFVALRLFCIIDEAHMIRELDLRSINFDENMVKELIAAIKSSQHLKSLYIEGNPLSDDAAKQLIPVLSNPEECQLSQFSCGKVTQENSSTADNSKFFGIPEAVAIVKANPNFTVLVPSGDSPTDLQPMLDICAENSAKQKAPQIFFDVANELVNRYYAPAPSNDAQLTTIQQLPPELILLILEYVGQFFKLSPRLVTKYSQVILKDIRERRRLIDNKEYDPSKINNGNKQSEVAKWWSQSRGRAIFKGIKATLPPLPNETAEKEVTSDSGVGPSAS